MVMCCTAACEEVELLWQLLGSKEHVCNCGVFAEGTYT